MISRGRRRTSETLRRPSETRRIRWRWLRLACITESRDRVSSCAEMKCKRSKLTCILLVTDTGWFQTLTQGTTTHLHRVLLVTDTGSCTCRCIDGCTCMCTCVVWVIGIRVNILSFTCSQPKHYEKQIIWETTPMSLLYHIAGFFSGLLRKWLKYRNLLMHWRPSYRMPRLRWSSYRTTAWPWKRRSP